ncbi:MAG: hypothetical protein WC536_03100 [Patescibacteria group bacterium]
MLRATSEAINGLHGRLIGSSRRPGACLSAYSFYIIDILNMMTATHIIAAGYVGERIGNPFIAFLVGIVIHFILDSIPHYDTTDGGKLTKRQLTLTFVDLTIGILIIKFLLKADLSFGSSFLWGAVGGIFPDILDVIPFWQKAFRSTKFGKRFHKFHDDIQRISLPPISGLLIQAIIIIIFSYLYLTR